jgi:hypothetical protein
VERSAPSLEGMHSLAVSTMYSGALFVCASVDGANWRAIERMFYRQKDLRPSQCYNRLAVNFCAAVPPATVYESEA